jgi:hypothetical protein
MKNEVVNMRLLQVMFLMVKPSKGITYYVESGRLESLLLKKN